MRTDEIHSASQTPLDFATRGALQRADALLLFAQVVFQSQHPLQEENELFLEPDAILHAGLDMPPDVTQRRAHQPIVVVQTLGECRDRGALSLWIIEQCLGSVARA